MKTIQQRLNALPAPQRRRLTKRINALIATETNPPAYCTHREYDSSGFKLECTLRYGHEGACVMGIG